jgi:hypothetical protein
MEAALRVVACVAIVSCVPGVLAARKKLRKTTLLGAWWWGVVALAAWAITFFATEVVRAVDEGVADQMWLASAALLVCPFVAVLGAKRPGSRVWDVFIVAPLAVVLDLPAVTAWNRDFHPARLALEVPMLAGYTLVTLMGAGNYLGTRFALPALLSAVAILAVPFSMSLLHWLPEGSVTRAGASVLLGVAIWLALWLQNSPRAAPPSPISRRAGREGRVRAAFDVLWADFRDLYGMVWARRVLDRINATATQENWPVRLTLHGFVALDPSRPVIPTPQQSQQIEHTLRWLLRRFVDSDWIDERLAERGA